MYIYSIKKKLLNQNKTNTIQSIKQTNNNL